MATILLMDVSGGDWLPILFVMIALMFSYNAIEWLVNYIERFIKRRQDTHY